MKLFFFDLELTGTNVEKHGVHQISGKIIIDGEVKEEFDFKVRPHPSAFVAQDALDVCQVTYQQIYAYPTMQEVSKLLFEMLAKYTDFKDASDRFHMVAYNGQVCDFPFLAKWFVRNGNFDFYKIFYSVVIDVMVLAADHLSNKRHLMANFKQSTVAEFLGIEIDKTKLHDGIYDIGICHKIYDIVSGKY